MPIFFALQPKADECREIVLWRDRALPPFERPVPLANLHITLAYLGETQDWQLDQLISSARDIEFRPLDLTLDEFGYWARAGVAWLGPREMPGELDELARVLRRLAGSLRLPTDKRPYHAHLTVARKLRYPPPAPTIEPRFQLHFDNLVLMESLRAPGGVRYRPLETFA